MKVANMTSSRGNKVPNQFIIESEGEREFQSYATRIIHVNCILNQVTIDKSYPYSKTTSKYASRFLGEDSKTIKRKIADGTYTIADLNK